MSGVQWMVVLIVAIAVIGKVLKHRHVRGEASADEPAASDRDDARLHDEVRVLKERIAVLERIATDRAGSLDREIEQLRDR